LPESAKLGAAIAVAIRAVIAGADNWVDIETFGNAKIEWFETFLASLPARADRILWAVRERWGVENGLHWTPGAPFGDDGSMVRVGQAAENMSTRAEIADRIKGGGKSVKR